MRKTRIQGIKPINKVLATYPNIYLPLHEGIADSAVDTVTDLTNGYEFTVAAPGATQWSATLGNYEPASGNTTQYITLEDFSADETVAEALFGNLQNEAWMVAVNLDYVRDDAAAQFILSVRDASFGGVNGTAIFDLRAIPDVGALSPLVFDFDTVATQANDFADAAGEQFYVAYIDMRTGVKQSTVYLLDPGSKVHNKTVAPSKSLASANFPAVQSFGAGGLVMSICARWLGSGYDKHVDVCGLRDLRFINFGQNPPTDIVDFIEELALNSNTGTRREY